MTSLNQDFKLIAINALANQCEREQNSPVNIISKIKGDISQIRISESKKRLRPSCFDIQADGKINTSEFKKPKPDIFANIGAQLIKQSETQDSNKNNENDKM